jgi:hypothetical protein
MGTLGKYDADPIATFGYTAREAEFLALVALHGGHFVAQQFCRYTDTQRGKAVATFIARALGKGHIREHPFPPGPGRRFHLCYRPIYAALGLPNSNHRRADTPTATIVCRIAALDYIIDTDEIAYLPTDRDKLGYFTSRGISEEDLPQKIYTSPFGRGSTHAYFPDKFPVGIDESTQKLTFVYVDEHPLPTTYFEAHIKNYLPLWRALGQPWGLAFVSTSPAKQHAAEDLFRQQLAGARGQSDGAMFDYFRMKRAFLAEDWKALSRADLVARINLAKQYETPRYKALYADWIGGKLADKIPSQAPKITPDFDLYTPPSFKELAALVP